MGELIPVDEAVPVQTAQLVPRFAWTSVREAGSSLLEAGLSSPCKAQLYQAGLVDDLSDAAVSILDGGPSLAIPDSAFDPQDHFLEEVHWL